MTTLASYDISAIESQINTDAMYARMLAKACHELHLMFLAEAARVPAWPLYDEPDSAADWLPPGTYAFAELQTRLAPRAQNDSRLPDPRHQTCATVVEVVVTSMMKTLLLLPEQDSLLDQATADGLDAEALLDLCMELIGTSLCERLLDEVLEITTELTATALSHTALRISLNEASELAEKHHLKRCLEFGQKRFSMLVEQWLSLSGPAGKGRITLRSPVLPLLHKWLLELDAPDAALFLTMYDVSSGVSSGKGLPVEFVEKVAKAPLPAVPFVREPAYQVLRSLMADILGIPGLRLLTVTKGDGSYVLYDIDACNRVGHGETHLAHLLNTLFEGLTSQSAIMVRAQEGETINVFDSSKGIFTESPVKHLYGALLDMRRYVGLSIEQVEHAHTTHHETGKPIAREASIVYKAWPSLGIR